MENSHLNRNFLQHLGVVENNSFVNISDPNPDNYSNVNETVTINLSSYYDYDNLVTILKLNKDQISICSTNIQSIKPKLDELNIFIEMVIESLV